MLSIRSKLLSLATGAALVASFVGVAPIAQASSLTPDQITAITNLLQSFNADPSAIANVQAVLSGTPSSTTGHGEGSENGGAMKMLPPTANMCARIATNLKRGSTGEDVTRLQSFLGIASTTGFFGPKTEEAVGQWQMQHSIIATGTPPTAANGFGVVGPRTRMMLGDEMEGRCKKIGMMGSSTPMMPLRPEEHMNGSSTPPMSGGMPPPPNHQ